MMMLDDDDEEEEEEDADDDNSVHMLSLSRPALSHLLTTESKSREEVKQNICQTPPLPPSVLTSEVRQKSEIMGLQPARLTIYNSPALPCTCSPVKSYDTPFQMCTSKLILNPDMKMEMDHPL